MTTAIQFTDATVRASRKAILDIPHLDIPAGQFLAILGPNGAGKTTLLRCILHMQAGLKGHVSIFGQAHDHATPSQRARLRQSIGYVPQLLPAGGEMPLTIREVVAIGRAAHAGLGHRLTRADWQLVDHWIQRLGLMPLASESFSRISGGEQRKTLIARAMVQQPRILLLDEPTANLDLGWRERIVQTIHELYQSTGLTILLVCHELEVLPPTCGRIVILTHGRITGDGPPSELLCTRLIESLYGPGLSLVRHAGRYAVLPYIGDISSAKGEVLHA